MTVLNGDLNVVVPVRGGDPGTWDTPVNTAFTTLADAMASVGSLALSNGANSPTIAQLAYNIIILTGTLSASATITMPAPTAGTNPGIAGRRYFVNQTTGAQTITILGSSSDTGQGQVFLLPLMTWQVAVVFDGTTAWYDNYAGIPPGSFMAYAGSTIPAGFLLCYGQSLVRVTYPQLFTAIGTTYGSVDGTHFSLPDLRGRLLAGADNMGGSAAGRMTGYTFNTTGGVQSAVVQQANLASFSLPASSSASVNDSGHTHTLAQPITVGQGQAGAGGGGQIVPSGAVGPIVNSNTTGISVGVSTSVSSGGSSTPFSLVQPTMATNLMIRY